MGARIIFISSSHVFDGSKPNYQTSELTNPKLYYAQLKSMTEKEILQKKKSNMVIRLTKVIDNDFNLFNDWIQSLIKGEPISAFIDLPIAPLKFKTTCQYILNLGKYSNIGGIWHLSASNDINYYQIACYISEQIHGDHKLVIPSTAKILNLPHLPKYTSLDSSLTEKLLKIKLPNSWELINQIITLKLRNL